MTRDLQRVTIAPQQLQGQHIVLTPEQQHYLFHVLRLQTGDRFIALNGQGSAWLVQLDPDQNTILEPLEINTELPIPLTLMVALPKGNGFEDIVRCGTELGVTTFIPVMSDRTLLHPSPKKVTRWRKIAQEATEQCERVILPQILDTLPFQAALDQYDHTEQTGYICVARGKFPHLFRHLFPPPTQPTVIMTGPEGGWTPKELETAMEDHLEPVSLGNRILRAITAPIVATSLVVNSLELER